jgi:hypothetical protein
MEEVRAFWEREGAQDETPMEHDVLLMHRALQEWETRHPVEATLRFRRELEAEDEPPVVVPPASAA